jgi:hypothetical protein
MFHNAARMARPVPPRTETPMTNLGLEGSSPLSDPPSARSAATPSSPSTPRDIGLTSVGVDPAFIDPALADLQDSPSEPLLSAKYFEYADGLYRNPSDVDMEVVPPVEPVVLTTGFVQRVRAMLESKAVVDNSAIAAARNMIVVPKTTPEVVLTEVHELEAGEVQREHSAGYELYELPANEEPHSTFKEVQEPVELPASDSIARMTIPELEVIDATERPSELATRRITVEMVRAELGPGSVASDELGEENDDAAASSKDDGSEKRTDHDSGDEAVRQSTDGQPFVNTTEESPNPPAVPKARVASTTTVSVNATLPSEAKYAMNFTSPAQSSVDSEETQSENPFALDADTMTIEHQNQEAAAAAATKRGRVMIDVHKPLAEVTENVTFNVMKVTSDPVSPLADDEHVQRFSAVSPLPSSAIAGSPRISSGTIAEMPGAFPETEDVASTEDGPPTPKAHVKTPWARLAVDNSESNATNHISLPGNTSTFTDSTMNTESDAVTDIAIRFSLPNATINSGRPQVVSVSVGATPEDGNADMLPSMRRGQITRTNRRTSVSFANEVAPLNISKRVESHQRAQSAGSGPLTAQSIARKPSPRNDAIDSDSKIHESTTEVRLPNAASNFNAPSHSRFASTQLPGLKEESLEDMSHINKDVEESPRFPASKRFAAIRAMQERRKADSAADGHAKKPRRDTARLFNRPLADTKEIPSLNFSRTDLIDKLNEALHVVPPPRDVKSMEILRPANEHRFSGIFCPSPQRPQSTEPLRERYTSFFCKPEDFSCFDVLGIDNDDEDDAATSGQADDKASENQDGATPKLIDADLRSTAEAELLEVASQVNRLSIPSVNGLSERLSELIPGLRNLQNFHFEDILGSSGGHESTDILFTEHHPRPGTILSTRSSGFRALAERAEEIVKNGTHDSIAAVSRPNTAFDKDLPPLPGSMSTDGLLMANHADRRKSPGLPISVSAPSDLNQGSRPTSALTTSKSPATAEEVMHLLPTGMNPLARNAKRSAVLSQPSSRPWNLDENYPWAENKVDIDLSDPSGSRENSGEGADQAMPSRDAHNTIALSTTHETVDLTTEQNGIDIGSIVSTKHSNKHDNASITTEQATGVSATSRHRRKLSARSIMGSITKKLVSGLKSRAPTEDSVTLNSASKSPVPQHETHASIEGPPAHRPGDRYPTSGLSPPFTGSNLNLDEVRSFFSDNSSDKKYSTSFRKRLNNLKNGGGGGSHGSKSRVLRLDRSSIRHLHLLHRYQNHSRQHHHRGHHSFDGTGHTTATSTYEADPTATTTTSLPGTPTLFDRHPTNTAGLLGLPSTATLTATTTPTPYPTILGTAAVVGMGKTEFHLKRFGEKLRHLLARSGDLFRSFSASARSGGGHHRGGHRVGAAASEGRLFPGGAGSVVTAAAGRRGGRRGRQREDSEDWLADSVYSGL